MMTDDACWQIIDDARKLFFGQIEKQAQAIVKSASELGPAEIMEFGNWLRTKMLEANLPDLLVAVEWIYAANGLSEVSGDSWEYQRGWVVGQGRQEFYAILENPDVLSDLFTTFEDFLGGEEIEYAANRAFEIRTGIRDCPGEMYDPSLIETWPSDSPTVIREREWLTKRFPKILQRFGPPRFLER